mmetsp:Transcript_1901/g.1818  ORF Transcript_1901/g.1818 Transcript_1901/m.1818 type:complete len:94 (-) Transcript_1901:377-658(-)
MLKCKVSKIMKDKIPELYQELKLKKTKKKPNPMFFQVVKSRYKDRTPPKRHKLKITDDIRKDELRKHLNDEEYKLVTETHPKYYLVTGEMIEK